MDKPPIKIFDFERICRLCMNEKRILIEIFESSVDNNNLTIDQKIKCCATVDICKGDGLPSRICIKCLSCLNAAVEFRNQCENSEKTLRNIHNLCSNRDQKLESNSDLENLVCEANDMKDIDKVILDYNHILIVQNQKTENSETQFKNFFGATFEEEQGESEKLFEDSLTSLHEKEPDSSNYLETAEETKNDIKVTKEIYFPPIANTEKAHKLIVAPQENRKGIGVTEWKLHGKQRPNDESLKSPCPFCNKMLTRVDEHIRLLHRNRVYVCTKGNCGAEFLTLKNLQSHQLRCFNVEKAFKCPNCFKDFHRKSNFKAHVRRHADKKDFQCQLCERAFVDSTGLKRHYLKHHEPEQEIFISGCCGKRFKSKEGLKKHIRKGICGFQIFHEAPSEGVDHGPARPH